MDDLDRMIYRAARGCNLVQLGDEFYACDHGGRVKLSRVVAMALLSRAF